MPDKEINRKKIWTNLRNEHSTFQLTPQGMTITSHRPPQIIYLIQNTSRKRSFVYVSFLKKANVPKFSIEPSSLWGVEDGVSKRSIFHEMSRYSISVRRRCVTPFLQLQLLPHKRRWNLTFVVTGGILSACFWFPDTKDNKSPLQMRPPSLWTNLSLRKVGKSFSDFTKFFRISWLLSPFCENVLVLIVAVSHINTHTLLPVGCLGGWGTQPSRKVLNFHKNNNKKLVSSTCREADFTER